MGQVHKRVAVAVNPISIAKKSRQMFKQISICLCILLTCAHPENAPADQLQIGMNAYIDNFLVGIFYPSISYTKKIFSNTSISSRYLVDAISAASMRSHFDVDGVSSATHSTHGELISGIDEVRQEAALGINQYFKHITYSLNGIYSIEHDYSSKTLAGNFTIPLANQNTQLQAGLTQSWDLIFPENRSWEKDKSTSTINLGVTQTLTPKSLIQVNYTGTYTSGYLSVPYQVVHIYRPEINRDTSLESSHPNSRIRQAAGIRYKIQASELSSIGVGYRFYWDDWEVFSHTPEIEYLTYNKARANLFKMHYRFYTQSKASFFEGKYIAVQEFVTVDSKLAEQYSHEINLETSFLPLTEDDDEENTEPKGMFDKWEVSPSVTFYLRHSTTPDWHSRRQDLLAFIPSISFRRHF